MKSTLLVVVLSATLAACFGSAQADSHEQPKYDSPHVDDYELRSWDITYPLLGLGIGVGSAEVIPNDDKLFLDESGLSLGVRLAIEKPLMRYLALHGALDAYSSASASSLGSATASFATMLSAGFTLGDVTRRHQLYISAAYGLGFAVLSDQGLDEQGNSVCILCSGEEGGSSAGAAHRLAIGYTGTSRFRVELAWMRVGGNGADRDFPNGEEAFLDSIQLSLIARGDPP